MHKRAHVPNPLSLFGRRRGGTANSLQSKTTTMWNCRRCVASVASVAPYPEDEHPQPASQLISQGGGGGRFFIPAHRSSGRPTHAHPPPPPQTWIKTPCVNLIHTKTWGWDKRHTHTHRHARTYTRHFTLPNWSMIDTHDVAACLGVYLGVCLHVCARERERERQRERREKKRERESERERQKRERREREKERERGMNVDRIIHPYCHLVFSMQTHKHATITHRDAEQRWSSRVLWWDLRNHSGQQAIFGAPTV